MHVLPSAWPLSVLFVPVVQPVKVKPVAVGLPTRIELDPLGCSLTDEPFVTVSDPGVAVPPQLVWLKRVNGTDMLVGASEVLRWKTTLPSVNLVVAVPDAAPVAVTV